MNKQISNILLLRVMHQLEDYISLVHTDMSREDAEAYTEDIKRDLEALKNVYNEQN